MNPPRIREAENRKNILVVALDVVPLDAPNANVLVVAPALNSRLRRWASDEDRARRRAAERLRAYELLAIADALAMFPADEIVIAADAEHLARQTRQRFRVPTSRAWEPIPVAA